MCVCVCVCVCVCLWVFVSCVSEPALSPQHCEALGGLIRSCSNEVVRSSQALRFWLLESSFGSLRHSAFGEPRSICGCW
jgi:hypothetical protein